jgi:hypothetical protein
MSLPFELKSARDVLAKAVREFDVLRAAIMSQDKLKIGDALYNFSITAYHVKDWLIKQPGASYSEKDVEDFVKNDPALSTCRDLCNSNKHKNITKYIPDAIETTASAMSIIPIAGPSTFNQVPLHTTSTPPFRVKVITSNGQRLEAVQLAEDVVHSWEAFFAKHGL